MPDDALYRLDLGKLMKDGIEQVYPRDIVTKPIKWIQEPTLANKTLQNSLLFLLAENEISYRDQPFQSPDYICFGDYNPAELGGTVDMRWPFKDRWDARIDIENLELLPRVKLTLLKYSQGHFKDTRKLFKGVLDFEQVKKIWDDVERVSVPEWVSTITEMYVETFTACIYDPNRVSEIYKSKCMKGACEFYDEFCSQVTRPVGYRVTDALMCFAKARAWRSGRQEIALEDVLFCLPFVLNHRLAVKSDFMSTFKNTFDFAVKAVDDILANKLSSWKKAAGYYNDVLKTYDEATLKKLEDMGKRDLAIRSLHEEAMKAVKYKMSGKTRKIIEEIQGLKGKGYTKVDIEMVRETIETSDLLSEDKKNMIMTLDTLQADLSESVFLTYEQYNKRFIPWLSGIASSLAKQLLEPEVKTYTYKELEIKVDSTDKDADEVSMILTFADSKQAESFRQEVLE
jgi:MoxR-like ATPase